MSSSRNLSKIEEGSCSEAPSNRNSGLCSSSEVVQLIQKIIAEAIGTYFVVFAGCGSVVVNKIYGSVTFPGICVVWGLIVMVMIYSLGHISGAHFNPAVTITFAIFRQFPPKQAASPFHPNVLELFHQLDMTSSLLFLRSSSPFS